jgi:DNA repair exonuclease SbcCD nuclease subunit
VLAGDLLDLNQITRFAKQSISNPIDEYMVALELLATIKQTFRQVWLIHGNHDSRPSKWIQKHSPGLFFLFKDILAALAAGIEYAPSGQRTGQRDFGNVFYRSGVSGWWVRIGDAVVAHPETFRKARLKTADLAFDYFAAHQDGVRAAIIGHTHFCGLYRDPERLTIECGCLYTEPMDYTMGGRLNYVKPHCPGYAVLYQEDGVTDVERTTYKEL